MYGFREVIVDQPYNGHLFSVEMNLGGGHGTFQGSKYLDCAGGFSYKPKHVITQNRFIYWRVFNDVLELTEYSTDFNLEDSQVRLIFQDSPILGPISIYETDSAIIILVLTVTSVNRFTFSHPQKVIEQPKDPKQKKLGGKLSSILQQALVKPLMNFVTLSIFDHAMNMSHPLRGACHLMPGSWGSIFAMTYENGGVTLVRVSPDDTLSFYDLRQSNIFSRILSFTPSALLNRGPTVTGDAVYGLSFFSTRFERQKEVLYLITLSGNGHLRLYSTNNFQAVNDWSIQVDTLVDNKFSSGALNDPNLQLRICSGVGRTSKGFPKFLVFIPGDGFKVFQPRNIMAGSTEKLSLEILHTVVFTRNAIVDMCLTPSYIFVLLNNEEDEIEWEVKSYSFENNPRSAFNLALLEPLPSVEDEVISTEPKDYYTNLIFNSSSFTSATIYNALSVFSNHEIFPKNERDWEVTKTSAIRIIENTIREIVGDSDEPLSDEEIYELNFKHWRDLYQSCVEYHLNTIKPIGLFFEGQTGLLTIIKKSRISFLRPTEYMETAFYFPQLFSTRHDEENYAELQVLLEYLELLEIIENSMDWSYKSKIERRLRERRNESESLWGEVAELLVEADSNSFTVEFRHFSTQIDSKLKVLAENPASGKILKDIVQALNSWDGEGENFNFNQETGSVDERPQIRETFMASRLGANLTYNTCKQLLQHRFLIMRNSLLLQALAIKFFPNNDVILRAFVDVTYAHAVLLNIFSMLELFKKNAEAIHENFLEIGLKVANLCNTGVFDTSIQTKLSDHAPIKLIELFCNTSLGSGSVRRRMLYANRLVSESMLLSYAQSLGSAIWITSDNVEQHPLEDFLIGAMQYSGLSSYASQMIIDPQQMGDRVLLRKFYCGISDLFLSTPLSALNRFLSILSTDLESSPYFTTHILNCPNIESAPQLYTQKIISLFQLFNYSYGVQVMASNGVELGRDSSVVHSPWLLTCSSLGFKSSLSLSDYSSALSFIYAMPRGGEVDSCLRALLSKLVESGDCEFLLTLPPPPPSAPKNYLREEIERVLRVGAKLGESGGKGGGLHQLLYAYYLSRKEFEKAGMCLIERVALIGFKGSGRSGLEVQRDTYLDALTCLSLIEKNEEGGGGSGGDEEDQDWLQALISINLNSTPHNDEEEDTYCLKERVKNYDGLLRECKLTSFLLLTPNDEPLRYKSELDRAKMCVNDLLMLHRYDEAIELALMWDISLTSAIGAFAKTVVALHCNILPGSGDLSDYLKHVPIPSGLNAEGSIPDLAMNILKKYVLDNEKGKETKLHKEATLTLLSYEIALPRWLIDSYKKRDVNQLLWAYMKYGYWGEATELALDALDASLGNRDGNEFDATIQTVSAFVNIPIIPYSAINELYNQMSVRRKEGGEYNYSELTTRLRDKSENYVFRVLETRQERALLFNSQQLISTI